MITANRLGNALRRISAKKGRALKTMQNAPAHNFNKMKEGRYKNAAHKSQSRQIGKFVARNKALGKVKGLIAKLKG